MDQEQQFIEVHLFTGEEIYLPIWEEGISAPLEVQLGCSWHRCKFCDFANDARHVFSLPEIQAKAQMLSQMFPDARRVFLLGENPLHLPMDMLRGIFAIVQAYFPQVNQIAMYARYDDVLRKTEQDLQELAAAGLKELHIGMESGSQVVLDFMDKGIAVDQALEACDRLHRAGITISFTMIAGLGGVAMSSEHAQESARFLNAAQPQRIWITGLLLWPNTPLYDMAQSGAFAQLTFHDRLAETRTMVAQLELQDCHFVDSTVLGTYTVKGHFPDQKDAVLQAMDQLLALPGGDHIPPIPTKDHR